MTQLESLRQEFEFETAAARKMLSIVPTDKFGWKPHSKSMTVKQLATHLAELPGWVPVTFSTDELDFGKNPYSQPDITSTEELMAYFEQNVEDGRKQYHDGKEDILDKPWTLRNGQTVYSVSPKRDVLRMAMSQIIHHRAQLGVYLRLLDVSIPGTYGPSADESF